MIMRLQKVFLSIPTLLLIILLQAILGNANILSLSFVIGVTSWTSIAKVVRTEVRQIRNSEYIIAAKCMGAGSSVSCGSIWYQTSSHRSCLW